MDIPRDATLDDVRLVIFRQHTHLAQLLDELEISARRVLAGEGERKPLHDALELLEGLFLRHLELEEKHLAKWLPAAGASHALLEDHKSQRARIKGLRHDREVFADPRTLAQEALVVVNHLRKDMAEEDAQLRSLA